MYRRYSQTGEGGMPLSQRNRNRVKNILILLLAAGLAAVLIISLPALKQRQETRALFVRRIQTECDEAVKQTTALSRNAGADSAALLAKIRSNLYAIRALNSMSTAAGGAPLLTDDQQVVTIQNMVDRYLSFLTTGMDTGEYQTNLQTALTELQIKVNSLEE